MNEHQFLTVGYKTPAMKLERSAALQAERLQCCGVEARAHGRAGHETWAPGLLGTDCFIHLGDVGQSIRGSVHTAMTVAQVARVPLAAPLTIQGETAEVRETARGPEAVIGFTFTDLSGAVRFRLVLDVLMPDAALMQGPPAKRPAHKRNGPPPADPRAGLEKIAARQLQPEHVITYGGAKNPIHLDPEFARSLGFRAPIAHGVMTAVWLLGALDKPKEDPKAPAALEAQFRFRRPVFWDDAMELWAAPGEGRYASLNADGKLTAEMAVAKAEY